MKKNVIKMFTSNYSYIKAIIVRNYSKLIVYSMFVCALLDLETIVIYIVLVNPFLQQCWIYFLFVKFLDNRVLLKITK